VCVVLFLISVRPYCAGVKRKKNISWRCGEILPAFGDENPCVLKVKFRCAISYLSLTLLEVLIHAA